jgi:hypothetical protein
MSNLELYNNIQKNLNHTQYLLADTTTYNENQLIQTLDKHINKLNNLDTKINNLDTKIDLLIEENNSLKKNNLFLIDLIKTNYNELKRLIDLDYDKKMDINDIRNGLYDIEI